MTEQSLGASARPGPAVRPDGTVVRTRVLFLINDLSRAGAETQLVELTLALDRRTYDPSILLLKSRNDFGDRLAAAGVTVIPLRRRGFWDVHVLWRLYREIRRSRPQLFHSYLYLSNLLGSLAARAAGVPGVIASQRSSYEATLTPLVRRVARLSHRLADRVIANSRAAFDEERAAGAPAERLVHVPNGVPFASGPRPDRATLGLPEGPLVLCLGQLEDVKGHRHLLEAWVAVRRSRPEARLVLVGDGPRRSRLEAQARRLGLADSLAFLGFRAPSDPYVAACDVLVQPSLTEGMPNAVLEAMARGRPVVASGVGGLLELVKDGETGLLVPPGEPEPLAAALLRLLGDLAFRASLGEAGRRRVEAHFSVEAMTRATEAVYRELLERNLRRCDTASASVPKSTGPTVTL